jgi:hypothetical protein
MSRHDQIHALKQFLDIKLATGQLSIEENLDYSDTLDELHRVNAQDKGLDFNSGERPSAKKLCTLVGSYCPNTNDLTKQPLEELYAFTHYKQDLPEEVLYCAGIVVSPDDLKKIGDAILVLDLFEVNHPSFTNVTSYSERTQLYEKEHKSIIEALEVRHDSALFRQHTHRQTY